MKPIILIITVLFAWGFSGVAPANTLSLHGMNWACGANNYVTVPWPDGLIGNENNAQGYARGQAAASAVLGQGGSTLRLPIEPPMTAIGTNWSLYTNVINGILAAGGRVILCYWTHDSYVTNMVQWQGMWDTVNATYANNTNVLYEPINEPASQANLNDFYAAFISRYNPTANKCILDGAGYAQNVTGLGSDARLNNQLLALHFYEWYDNATNSSVSYNDTAAGVGPYASRTVITETGAPTDGYPIVSYWQQYGYHLDPYVSSMSGCLAWARDNNVGVIQWSGINSQDFFHWSRGLGNLTVARPDLAQMFQWAWGEYGPPINTKNLLTDSFFDSTPGDENLNNNLSARQTGLLASLSWTGASSWATQMANPTSTNLLVVNGATPYLNGDFSSTVNSLNLPMVVSFLGTLQAGNDGGSSDNWFGFMLSSSANGWINQSPVQYGILFRENGGTQIFTNGNVIGEPSFGTGYISGQYVPITLVFSDSSGLRSPFNWNGSMVTAYANGIPFATNNIGQLTTGYIGFTCNGWGPTNFSIVNIAGLQISTVVPGVAPYFGITPQSVTNWAGVPTTLFEAVVGSQPVSFQWYSNNVALAGQTNASLYVADPEATTAYVLQAANADGETNSPPIMLTVENPAQSDQMLFSTKYIALGLTDVPQAGDYQGEFFTTGPKPRVVTHLGYFDATGAGTTAGHHVGIFQNGNLIAGVYVAPGSGPSAAYGYRWMPLTKPVTLLPNTTYVIFGDNNALDYWPNNFVPNWNSAYLGTNFLQNYLSWNWDGTPFTWPDYPSSATMVGDQGWNEAHAFGSVNLGSFPMTLSHVGAAYQINWTLGTLTSSTNMAGPYLPVPGAANPYALPLNESARFYRLRWQ